MAGIPAIYVNNFFAQPGDRSAAVASGVARDITRAPIDFGEARDRLADTVTPGGRATRQLVHMLGVRAGQAAFHPDAPLDLVLDAGPLLAFERRAPDGRQTILAVSNLGPDEIDVSRERLGLAPALPVPDLLSGGELSGPDLTLEPYQTVWLSSVMT
jgi:sucrose phosphorylase